MSTEMPLLADYHFAATSVACIRSAKINRKSMENAEDPVESFAVDDALRRRAGRVSWREISKRPHRSHVHGYWRMLGKPLS
jgi:hypothetical protein